MPAPLITFLVALRLRGNAPSCKIADIHRVAADMRPGPASRGSPRNVITVAIRSNLLRLYLSGEANVYVSCRA